MAPRQKFVLRLLDSADRLLAWAEEWLEPSPDGFRTPSTLFLIDAAGEAARVSVHWTEPDAARVEPITATVTFAPEHVGRQARLAWLNPVWPVADWHAPVVHDPSAPRPPVTVRTSIVARPPVGDLGWTDARET